MENAMHTTNLYYFKKMFMDPPKPHDETASPDLCWLRRLGKQGNVYPHSDDVITFMETNHSTHPLPGQEVFNPIGDPTEAHQFDPSQFSRACRSTKSKSGRDYPPFLITISHKFHEYFLKVINSWLINSSIPQKVLKTNLWLIYKKGERTLPGSFRPISIPTPLYNILAKMLLRKAQEEAEDELYTFQYGFRRGYSCSEAAILFRVQTELLKEQNPQIDTIFIDLRKAFDSVPHEALFKQLDSYLSHKTTNALKLIYKTGTVGTPTTGRSPKGEYTQRTGVRQGCPLSPLLFALFINSALTKLQSVFEGSNITIAFADDIEISAPTEILPDVTAFIVESLEQLGLTINVSKCAIMHHYSTTKEDQHMVKINGEVVPTVKTFKYLGYFAANELDDTLAIVLEEHNSFIQHISGLPLTCLERIKLINTIAISRLSFRLIPIIDLVPESFWDKIEATHLSCIKEVSGISGFTVPQTFYTMKPLGYGLRHSFVATISTAALAMSKLLKRHSFLLQNTTFIQFKEFIESKICCKEAGGLKKGSVDTQTQLSFGAPHPTENVIKGVQFTRFSRSEFHQKHPTFPLPTHKSDTIFCDGSLQQNKMAGAAIFRDAVFVCTVSGMPSSYRAEAAALLIACEMAKPYSTVKLDNEALVKKVNTTNPALLSYVIVDQIRSTAAQKNLVISWVKGHNGIVGNEQSDFAAKCALQYQIPVPRHPQR